MTFKVRVTYSRDWDSEDNNEETRYNTVYHDYYKEFNTKEELGLFILDLADKEQEEIVVSPIYTGDHPYANQDYRDIEIYNDYRE